MVDLKNIKEFSSRLVREYRPQRVILFGSYANGTPRPDSDVDLFVIMPFKGQGALKAAEMAAGLNPPFAVDIVVRTASQVKRRLALNDFFVRGVLNNGRVLYEAADARMD